MPQIGNSAALSTIQSSLRSGPVASEHRVKSENEALHLIRHNSPACERLVDKLGDYGPIR